MKQGRLRMVWILLNVWLYLMLIGTTIFIMANAEGLQEINRLFIFIVITLVLGLVAISVSFRIWNWIKEGRL